MPLYEYEEAGTGRVIELCRPVRLRDDCPPNLKRVISRTGRPRISGQEAKDPSHADQAVPRALRELENTMPTSEVERQTGFSAKQLKKTWKIK